MTTALNTFYLNFAKIGIVSGFGGMSFSSALSFISPTQKESFDIFFTQLSTDLSHGTFENTLQILKKLQATDPEIVIAKMYIEMFLYIDSSAFTRLQDAAVVYAIVQRVRDTSVVTDKMKLFLRNNLFITPEHELYAYLQSVHTDLAFLAPLQSSTADHSPSVTAEDVFPDISVENAYVFDPILKEIVQKTAEQAGIPALLEEISKKFGWFQQLLG